MEIQLWRSILCPYELAVRELEVKFNHIIDECKENDVYCPIEQVEGRVKSVSSILEKMQRKHIPMERMEEELEDIAGVRIICQFEEDIETVLAKGHFVVMPLDMCGAIAMKRHFPTVIVYVARDKELLIRDIIEQDYSIEEKTLRILSIDAEKRNRQICDYAVNNMDVGVVTRELSDVLENNCL